MDLKFKEKGKHKNIRSMYKLFILAISFVLVSSCKKEVNEETIIF